MIIRIFYITECHDVAVKVGAASDSCVMHATRHNDRRQMQQLELEQRITHPRVYFVLICFVIGMV